MATEESESERSSCVSSWLARSLALSLAISIFLPLSLSLSAGKVDFSDGRSYYLLFSLSTIPRSLPPGKAVHVRYPLDVSAATSNLLVSLSLSLFLSFSLSLSFSPRVIQLSSSFSLSFFLSPSFLLAPDARTLQNRVGLPFGAVLPSFRPFLLF